MITVSWHRVLIKLRQVVKKQWSLPFIPRSWFDPRLGIYVYLVFASDCILKGKDYMTTIEIWYIKGMLKHGFIQLQNLVFYQFMVSFVTSWVNLRRTAGHCNGCSEMALKDHFLRNSTVEFLEHAQWAEHTSPRDAFVKRQLLWAVVSFSLSLKMGVKKGEMVNGENEPVKCIQLSQGMTS